MPRTFCTCLFLPSVARSFYVPHLSFLLSASKSCKPFTSSSEPFLQGKWPDCIPFFHFCIPTPSSICKSLLAINHVVPFVPFSKAGIVTCACFLHLSLSLSDINLLKANTLLDFLDFSVVLEDCALGSEVPFLETSVEWGGADQHVHTSGFLCKV